MNNPTLRASFIQEAEASFISLTIEIDALFNLIDFYLDRFPSDGTKSAEVKDRELSKTVDNLAQLVNQLSQIVKSWKNGDAPVLSASGTEINILNEIWANIGALIYFLLSHQIDLEPFSLSKSTLAFNTLVKCNRVLT